MIDIRRVPQMDLDGYPIRIGAVSYLNSKPLIEGLDELVPDAELILDLPSRLADDLARGELDVALIPSIEAFADPDYEIVSNACVATRGPVLSVKLYTRVHPGEVKTLALDEGSRTSAALVQIMLHDRYGVTPKLSMLPMGSGVEDSEADAILLIGDRAMHPPQEKFHTVWDLGQEWLTWTGLPFVFAMWVTRAGTDLGPVADALARARDRGVQEIPNIAQREASGLGIARQKAADYLTRNLHFRLGSAERNGLKQFHRLASRLGLAPEDAVPEFRSSDSTSTINAPLTTLTQS
ncbi:MAG: menaquinone biosynthesis protein [Planctomycetaceae bacterium]|nr:menaquinone biosynthesis protein [Planctomycetaceae bacterium]